MPAPLSTDKLCINTIRTLAIDAVQRANSGHPGTPMGAAAIAYTIWTRFLRHNPADPQWPNRDRFVLSPGHASMLLYALLHLTGYDLPLEELQRFRQWGSKTPGHPEYGLTPGVEATTGPLGQGFGMGIGMAVAERFLGEHFNRPGHPIIDHHVYGIVSDGDLMEGISSEAASLAGTLKLGKVVYLYDDNDISIEGSTQIAFTEQVGERFDAYGWHVQRVDGNDVEAVARALAAARGETERPSLIIARTVIGFGSPHKAGTAAVHGAPLGEDEVRLTKDALGWPEEPPFYVPPEALAEFRKALDRGRAWQDEWLERLTAYERDYPTEAKSLARALAGELPEGWADALPAFSSFGGELATRVASGKVLNAIVPVLPTLVGGSADLAPSTDTYLKGYGDFDFDQWCGHNMHFGVREHAMGAIVNGMALHGGVIPYGATFLVFSDYMRPSLRLASLMKAHSIFIFTHDSIGLGEDGPTHQPIEHLASLRAMPNLTVLRPADANETAACWRLALERSGPTALVLSRQGLPVIDDVQRVRNGVARGAYVLAGEDVTPDVVLIATGSEVALALAARELLAERGLRARVVSMPGREIFEEQPQSYRDVVLPPAISTRVVIEMASSFGWRAYAGDRGEIIALDHFGASAPGKVLQEQFGFTPEHVAERAQALIEREGERNRAS
jgi:transketolase